MKIGQSIWYSSRISRDNSEIDTFENPKEIRTRFNYFSIMPATSRGYMAIMNYGEDIENTWTAIANDRCFHGKIKVGDKFWLDGENPIPEIEEKYGNGASANAVVKNVSYVNISIQITLTRNKEQIKE